MAALACLRAPVDAFFDKVTVNDPDPAKREARLNLLAPDARRGPPGRRFLADRGLSGARRCESPCTCRQLHQLPARKRPRMSYVYRFGGGVSDGEAGNKNLLGGKGANLAEMASIGLPVPPGFTIATAVCALYDARAQASATRSPPRSPRGSPISSR